MKKDTEKYLGVDVVARRFNVSRDVVYKWIASKRLPVLRLDRMIRIRQRDLDAFEVAHRYEIQRRRHGHHTPPRKR